MIKLVKIFGTAAVLSSFMMPLAVAGGASEHATKAACYASIHSQCYGNGENNCTEEEYNMGLDWCDEYYPIAEIDTQQGPSDLKANAKRGKTFMLR